MARVHGNFYLCQRPYQALFGSRILAFILFLPEFWTFSGQCNHFEFLDIFNWCLDFPEFWMRYARTLISAQDKQNYL